VQQRYLDFVGSRRPGLQALGRLIDRCSESEPEVAESVLECRLYAVLGRPGMPAYRRQAPLPWAPERRADAVLVDAPVLIEADGRRWHSRRADFERDRRRDNLAVRHGFHTLRYTYSELTEGPDAVAAEVREVHDRLVRPSSR
jgi:very-short-patch-repair endonuclease